MKKQTIEIEVPEGKQAIWEDNTIKFIPEEPYWKKITKFEDAFFYVRNNLPECYHLIESYNKTLENSYEEDIISYRIVVAALTNNEKRSLTIGDKWYPIVQFCRPKNKRDCLGYVLIGTIESEGKKYSVVGGDAVCGLNSGLGCFGSGHGGSGSTTRVGFRSVSSKEIAEHISTYFGKLLFNVIYGGVNCNWRWVD